MFEFFALSSHFHLFFLFLGQELKNQTMKRIAFILTGLVMTAFTHVSIGQQNQETGVIYCDYVGVSRPLYELAKENPVNLKKLEKKNLKKLDEKKDEWISKDKKYRKPNKYEFTVESDGVAYGNDSSVLQRDLGSRPMPQTRVNVNGVNNGSYPHDPSGAAGPNHYVQAVNATTYRIINKITGATITTGSVGSLWSPATANDGDPIVMYDRFADRWFIAQFGTSGNKIYIAVSTTNDPGGSYYTYTYTSPQFPDYLKFSIWHDGYYMTSNQSNQKVFAFERSVMLTGGAARSVYTTFNPPDGGGFFCPLPADADGNQGLPPSGACPIFSYSDNGWGGSNTDAIQIYQMAVNWTPTTPTATISFVSAVPTAAFDGSYNASWNDIAQPGTTQKLDGIGGVLTYRAQWRKWSGYNTVVLTWGVKISTTQRSIMWAELRQNQSTGAWTMYQQGIYTPDSYYRWISSIAMDDAGNIALCYTKSGSSTIYPGLYYTGRLASDPLNQMTFAEATAVAGLVSQTGGINRWGDYSHTSLDPDGATFWHTAEWGGGNASNPKRTRIYSFQLASTTTANVSITSSDADNIICTGTSVTFTANPINGGTTPTYQWQVNGANVGTNSPTYTATSLPSGAVVTCIMTSNLSGVIGSPATSNAITTTVVAPVTPTISINGTSTICAGTAVTFTTSTANSGSTPSYQWQVNGANVGSNSSVYVASTLTNGAAVTCILTSSANCASPTTVTSAPITMTVNPTPPTPTITNVGGVLTSSAATGNQWYLNGVAIAGATGQTYTPTANGVYTVKVTVNGCTSSTSANTTINGVGLDELNAFGLNIFPNPSQGAFNVTFNAVNGEEYTITVFDEVGRNVYQGAVNNQSGEYTYAVQLGKVADGMYNVRITNGKTEANRKVVIKN